MAVQQARVPVLDESGRFPDAYAPPSVAADAQAAQEAREGAETARTQAVTAQGKAEEAQQGAEQALAGVPAAVDGALATQVQAAQTAANDAGTARNQAQEFAGQAQTSAGNAAGSASDAQDAVNAVPAAVTSALSTWFLRGNGSPVGVITPTSAGVQYVDIAATNGARVWISTGTTSSAWRVVNGDTGWRDVTASLAPALGASSLVRIRRSNDFVVCALNRINATPTTQAFFTLPTGFNPAIGPVSAPLFPSGISGLPAAGGHLSIPWNGVNAYVIGTSSWCDGFITWATISNWPTTLPGTPA